MTIGVVIVEPRFYINVGYVARIMKNFGVRDLYLVDPDYEQEEASRFAMHGRDILRSATITNLGELRESSKLLVGTTALRSSTRLNILRDAISSVQLADLINSIPKLNTNVLIVLGREASGLKNSELEICDLVVGIETGTRYCTLNISHALGIILYEITKKGLRDLPISEMPRAASRSETDLLSTYVLNASDLAGYDMHKRHMLASAFKRLVAKSNPSSKEVMLMVSLLRKCILRMERQQNIAVSPSRSLNKRTK